MILPKIKGCFLQLCVVLVISFTQEGRREASFSEERYLEIVESIKEGYYELDSKGCFTFLNQAFSVMLGLSKGELLEKKFEVLLVDGEEFAKSSKKVLQTGVGIKELVCSVKAKNGLRFLETSLLPVRDFRGKIKGLCGVARDITERKKAEILLKEAEKKVDYLQNTDRLTGLYNRFFFEETLSRLDKKNCFPVSMITVDIDGLKLINDTLGHNIGNELLKAAWEYCQSALSERRGCRPDWRMNLP